MAVKLEEGPTLLRYEYDLVVSDCYDESLGKYKFKETKWTTRDYLSVRFDWGSLFRLEVL